MKKIIFAMSSLLAATAALGASFGLQGCPLCWARKALALLGFGS